MEHSYIALSNMLSAIIDRNGYEFFSTVEDNLFSKLQFQTVKLSRILQEQNRKVEGDRNEIQALISNTAHQFKTPLSNLVLYQEFLADPILSLEKRAEFQQIVRLELKRLVFLTENLIKMSRLEGDMLQITKKKQNLQEGILAAVHSVRKKAEDKQIGLVFSHSEKIELSYDMRWFSEAIFNLLENAVKYTESGGMIIIAIQPYEMFARIDITDTGKGIRESDLSKIFMRFYRGEETQHIPGMGIGLYVTRKIISKHGGYMKVQSGKSGSTSRYFCPLKKIAKQISLQ